MQLYPKTPLEIFNKTASGLPTDLAMIRFEEAYRGPILRFITLNYRGLINVREDIYTEIKILAFKVPNVLKQTQWRFRSLVASITWHTCQCCLRKNTTRDSVEASLSHDPTAWYQCRRLTNDFRESSFTLDCQKVRAIALDERFVNGGYGLLFDDTAYESWRRAWLICPPEKPRPADPEFARVALELPAAKTPSARTIRRRYDACERVVVRYVHDHGGPDEWQI